MQRWWDGNGWTDRVQPKDGPAASAASASNPTPTNGFPPPNYLVYAILVTLFCCLPLGIYSIVKASQVNGLWQSGQHDEALAASNTAKQFIWISFGVGLAFIIIFGLLGALSGDSSSTY